MSEQLCGSDVWRPIFFRAGGLHYMKMDSASSRILNVNVGILGHIDSGKTSLGISPLRISTSSFSSQLLIASAQLNIHFFLQLSTTNSLRPTDITQPALFRHTFPRPPWINIPKAQSAGSRWILGFQASLYGFPIAFFIYPMTSSSLL